MPALYAAEPVVVVSMSDSYKMQADGTGVQERTVVARVQAESALKELAVLSLGFAANSQHVEWVYARLRHVDGTVTDTPVDSAIEVAQQVTREAPFYSDLKGSQLPLKDLRVGDTLEWRGRIVRTKAEAADEFWGGESFEKSGVILSETLELDVPKDKYLNVWSPKTKAVEASQGDRHIYRWSWENREPTVGAQADAAKEAEKRRVKTAEEEIDNREGKLPDVAWTTFKSWQAVGAWYRGLEGEGMMPDAEIKAKVAKLTEGKTTEEAKVQAVYAYVATQIHYIGVAFGVGRYQPHSAADVLSNQYGDCKDKHTLLAALLEALGLHPDAVLIGVGIRFNEAVPSPEAFNHLITRVALDGKETWLDTTAEVSPYGMLIYATRDKQALVVPESGAAKVERTPARPPFAATIKMDAVGKLDGDGVSTSKITWILRGDEEIYLRALFRQISPAQYDAVVKQLLGTMGFGGAPAHVETSRAEDASEPFRVSFDYKHAKAGDWDKNHQTVPQLYPAMLPLPDESDPPVQSIELGVPRVELSTAAMTLPEGWTGEPPLDVHLKSEWVRYDLTFHVQKGVLRTERRLEILKERVAVGDWKAYAALVKKAEDDDSVQLLRQTADAETPRVGIETAVAEGVASAVVGASAAPSAKQLVHDGFGLVNQRALSQGEAKLKEAEALNPAERDLWTAYGNLALFRNSKETALADYKKEVELHPDEVRLYSTIASLEYGEERYGAAVTAAKLAVANSEGAAQESNERLLGRAQLRAGQKEDAHATLLALAKSTANPDMMNDAAYELANAGLELPLAYEVTRTALEKLEAESLTWTPDEDEKAFAKLQAQSSYLEATWDTMGWVLFREGKVDEAAGYIGASWRGRQSAEVGGHLAEIALAKGDKDGALTTYRLAIAASSPGALQKELMAAAEKLEREGARTAVSNAPAELQKMRTLPAGKGANGVVEYKMVAASEGLVRAVPAVEKGYPDAEARMRQANLKALFPPGDRARLALDVILSCHQGMCELVLVK